MAGKTINLVCVGKLKTVCWKQAADHYIKIIAPWREIKCIELKDGEAGLPPAERIRQEGRRILASLADCGLAVALDAGGVRMSSPGFADLLRKLDESGTKKAAFVVGGAFGLAPVVLKRCQLRLSLSAMTFPHELARVILLEQLFRGESIIHHTPYHH